MWRKTCVCISTCVSQQSLGWVYGAEYCEEKHEHPKLKQLHSLTSEVTELSVANLPISCMYTLLLHVSHLSPACTICCSLVSCMYNLLLHVSHLSPACTICCYMYLTCLANSPISCMYTLLLIHLSPACTFCCYMYLTCLLHVQSVATCISLVSCMYNLLLILLSPACTICCSVIARQVLAGAEIGCTMYIRTCICTCIYPVNVHVEY